MKRQDRQKLSPYLSAVQTSTMFTRTTPKSHSVPALKKRARHKNTLGGDTSFPDFEWKTPKIHTQAIRKVIHRSHRHQEAISNNTFGKTQARRWAAQAKTSQPGSAISGSLNQTAAQTQNAAISQARMAATAAGFTERGRMALVPEEQQPGPRIKSSLPAASELQQQIEHQDDYTEYQLSPHTMWMLRRWKARALGLQTASGPIALAPLRHTQQQIVKAQLKAHESAHQSRIAAAIANRKHSITYLDSTAPFHQAEGNSPRSSPGPPRSRRGSVENIAAMAVVHAMMPLSARSSMSSNSERGGSQSPATSARAERPQPQDGLLLQDMTEHTSSGKAAVDVAQSADERLRIPKERELSGTQFQAQLSSAFTPPSNAEAGSDSDDTDTLISPSANAKHTVSVEQTPPVPLLAKNTNVDHAQSRLVSESEGISQLRAKLQSQSGESHTLGVKSDVIDAHRRKSLAVAIPAESAVGVSTTSSAGPVSGKAARVLGTAISALQRTSPTSADAHSHNSSSLSGWSETDSD